ncbi:MAG: serine protease [Opitutaceae bacterium]|nr:serine protease [Opitutaceae bacterium]
MPEVFRTIAPAVVRVQAAIQSDSPSGRAPTRLICTGVFISKTGRLLTFAGEHNEVARASRIWIEKDGLPYLAQLIGSDPRSKIALLQAVKLPPGFEWVSVEPGHERPPVGTTVVAVTSPLSIDDPSPTTGLLAGYESNFGENIFPFSYARVTIPSGDAESGSPVLDIEGRLVGISVASLPQYNSSYLIPTRAIARIIEDLDATGQMVYPSLPIECDEHADTRTLSREVIIARIAPDSAASRAGIRVGDTLRRIDGVNIRRLHDYRDALFFAKTGQYLQFEVEREGRLVTFQLPAEPSVQESAPLTAPPPLTTSPTPAPGNTPVP